MAFLDGRTTAEDELARRYGIEIPRERDLPIKIRSDPISRMKPELNKANNSAAAQCPTCHATTSFDAHDASVNLQL
jgi:hypothetical protein